MKRELVSYPFQLRPGLWVHVLLPADFDADDLQRIVRVLPTLALPPLSGDPGAE